MGSRAGALTSVLKSREAPKWKWVEIPRPPSSEGRSLSHRLFTPTQYTVVSDVPSNHRHHRQEATAPSSPPSTGPQNEPPQTPSFWCPSPIYRSLAPTQNPKSLTASAPNPGLRKHTKGGRQESLKRFHGAGTALAAPLARNSQTATGAQGRC